MRARRDQTTASEWELASDDEIRWWWWWLNQHAAACKMLVLKQNVTRLGFFSHTKSRRSTVKVPLICQFGLNISEDITGKHWTGKYSESIIRSNCAWNVKRCKVKLKFLWLLVLRKCGIWSPDRTSRHTHTHTDLRLGEVCVWVKYTLRPNEHFVGQQTARQHGSWNGRNDGRESRGSTCTIRDSSCSTDACSFGCTVALIICLFITLYLCRAFWCSWRTPFSWRSQRSWRSGEEEQTSHHPSRVVTVGQTRLLHAGRNWNHSLLLFLCWSTWLQD